MSAITPKAAEVRASPRKIKKNECSARRPATAGPAAKPRLIARRLSANAGIRSPARVRSVRSAAAAGRYISPVRPASVVRMMISGSDRACESASSVAAELNIESASALRRPNRSATQPPTPAATTFPTP